MKGVAVSKQTYLKNVSKVIDFDVKREYIYSIKTNERYIKYKPTTQRRLRTWQIGYMDIAELVP